MKTIGERLKFLRKDLSRKTGRRLSQQVFAQEMGVGHRTLSDYESNKSLPKADFLKALVTKYRVNLTWLLDGDGEPYETTLADRLGEIVERSGLNLGEFAAATEVEAETLKQYLDGSVRPPKEFLTRVARQFSYSPFWLWTGHMPKRAFWEEKTTPDKPAAPAMRPEDYYLVGQVEGAASAGPGRVAWENIVDYFPFKQAFIHKIGGTSGDKRKNIYLLRVKGNSMVPTIADGELVLINCNDECRVAIENDGIYALRSQDGDVVIKRLYLLEGDKPRLLVMSDNKNFRTYHIDLSDQDLRDIVLGRVVWVGKELV